MRYNDHSTILFNCILIFLDFLFGYCIHDSCRLIQENDRWIFFRSTEQRQSVSLSSGKQNGVRFITIRKVNGLVMFAYFFMTFMISYLGASAFHIKCFRILFLSKNGFFEVPNRYFPTDIL